MSAPGLSWFMGTTRVWIEPPGGGVGSFKKKSGTFTYASAGVGSATHWAAERLRLSGGYEATHIPFKGGPEALTEVMAGRVDYTCMGISAARSNG